MKLSKVTIENYRGFYGKNVIEFDTGKKEKNINLVIARNDTGKTTFLNAIYWCLYGEEQFYRTRKSNKKIMSNKKIAETPIDGKMKLLVSLVFNDSKGPKYDITRERIFKRSRNKESDLEIVQQGDDILYGMENPTGKGFEEIEHINSFINSNIPPGISSFFLLDGEQLKAIFTSDIPFKIREAIEKVANISAITGMISNLNELERKYSRDITGMDSNYGLIQSQIDKCNVELEGKNEDLKKTVKENEDLKRQIMELVDFLGNHSEAVIREYGAREKRIREENELIASQIKSDESELNKLVVESYIVDNSKNFLNSTLSKFDDIVTGGNFPPAVDPAHVLQLLKRKECICGGKIKKGSEEEKRLQKLANARSYKEYVRVISEGAAKIPEMINSMDDKISQIAKLREKISKNESKLEKNTKELEEISQKLKDSNAEEIKQKVDEKEMTERAIYRTERDKANLESNIQDLYEVKKGYERDLANVKIRDMKDKLLIKKSEKCKELTNYAKNIKETIMKKIKNEIEKSTARNFRELHWKAGDYEEVSISDDFSLSIKDKYKGELINELSQGAALCFGLAFMTALRNYSGYDVPVIIDSPVGKIDEGNRENIASNLPNHLRDKQVIFLVTSSEYTSVFKEFLEDKISTKINLIYNNKTGKIDIKNGGD